MDMDGHGALPDMVQVMQQWLRPDLPQAWGGFSWIFQILMF